MSALAQELGLLETRGLVRVSLEREKPMVRFKHALTRQATYNSMLQARRAELHRAAARTLADLNPQPDLEMVLTIAEHWQNGAEDANALAVLVPYTQPLVYTGRSSSLIALLNRLNRANLTGSGQAELDLVLADAHAAQGAFETAEGLYRAVLENPSSGSRRAQILHNLGTTLYHLNRNEEAIEYQKASLELARETDNRNLLARASNGLGLAFWNLGDYAHAEENLRTSRELGLALGESIELASAEYGLAGVALDRGDFQTALGYAEHALSLYQAFGHTTLMVRAMQMLGACYYGLKNLPRAAEMYLESIASSRRLGDTVVVALGLGNLAEVYADWNELEKAIATYTAAIRELRTLKYDSLLSYYLSSLASVEIRRATAKPSDADGAGELAQAQVHLEEAVEIAVRIDSQEDVGLAKRVRAELEAARGNWQQANARVEEAIVIFRDLGRAIELERAIATRRGFPTATGTEDTDTSHREG